MSLRRQGERYRFDDLTVQPRKIITSPIWSGIESEERRYSPFVINIEEKVPFRTLTGPGPILPGSPLDARFRGAPAAVSAAAGCDGAGGGPCAAAKPDREIVLNYLTPHSKWSIHSTYSDTLTMLTLFRGGEAIWINDEDARKIDVRDNDWLECFNANGVVMAKAVVSPRIPPGKAFMYHAQERLINTPGSKLSGQTGRDPQQCHPDHGQTHPHDRRVCPAELWVQLLRPGRLPAGRGDRGPQGRGGGLV